MQDVFISYSRRNLEFATKLFDNLKSEQFNVWFDQQDIPLGVDFQEEINDGIAEAHYFLFIISPDSVKSPYCRKEVELAVRYQKSIIPVLYKELVTEEDWKNMHPVIGKINWIYFLNLDQPFVFERSFLGLKEVINRHRDYVEKHTIFLNLALNWERNQKVSHLLLTGSELQDGTDWLATKFKEVQPPCLPTDLHCEFICQSKENGDNLLTDVFLGSVSDAKFQNIRHRINYSLMRNVLTTWNREQDLKVGELYEEAVKLGVVKSDNFVFFITKENLRSLEATIELRHAVAYHKPIIPVLLEDVPKNDFPIEIHDLSVVDFTIKEALFKIPETQYRESLDDLIAQVLEERKYYRQHTILLYQSLRWERQKQNPSMLLRGYNLQNAQTWLEVARRHKHSSLSVQEKYITESSLQSGQLDSDVFISYSRLDSGFARKLNEQLQIYGKNTWFDQESLLSGNANFEAEIFRGIEGSDNFLFVISPSSIASDFCQKEIEFAEKLNKRFITVYAEDTEITQIPKQLIKVQWIDFRAGIKDFALSLAELIRAIDTDVEHVQAHTNWLKKASEWDSKSRPNYLLLLGKELQEADEWLKRSQNKKPQPTQTQKDFIEASWKAMVASERKEKRRLRELWIATFVLFFLFWIAVVLAGLGYGYYNNMVEENRKLKLEYDNCQKELRELKRKENLQKATTDTKRKTQ